LLAAVTVAALAAVLVVAVVVAGAWVVDDDLSLLQAEKARMEAATAIAAETRGARTGTIQPHRALALA
jgi:hypothetical protein